MIRRGSSFSEEKNISTTRSNLALKLVSAGLSLRLTSLMAIILDQKYVRMNTISMSITPKAIQDLLDELEASKQSRLRAWSVLQKLRMVLSELGSSAIPPPAQKTFDAEREALEHALRKSFRLRNDAIKSLCSSVRRFRDATIKEECKGDYPHALQALWKALDRAEDLIQN
jgi:hypothetical protein